MRIGELARRTSVDEQLLRYYEKQGLLAPERSSNGYREYADTDVGVVLKIRAMLAAGLSTATISQVGSCLREEALPAPACSGVVERLRGERDRLDRAIEELQSARAALDDVIRRGENAEPGGRPGEQPPWAPAQAGPAQAGPAQRGPAQRGPAFHLRRSA
ncbi:MerR family transcriptional regulator [Nonomuraea sp. B12E4]|uniref:MerR family transcriptional regulator n=1 Tax=Nonomuraea sp. B12E4 TaxID=3153564 RepID=UPI00325E9239